MKRFRFPKVFPDPVKEARVDELLRIAAALKNAGRLIPGHVRRELARLHEHWGKREIPAEIIQAWKLIAAESRR